MAQRREKEEAELKVVPENVALCVKCAVAGSHASSAKNMCQKCFNTKAEASTSGGAKAAKSHALVEKSFRSGPHARLSPQRSSDLPQKSGDPDKEAAGGKRREVSRCSGCRRKVGLTGFRCRCGELFCASHRYSDRHDCSYDYKSAGREAIARENPVVKAAKIVKI